MMAASIRPTIAEGHCAGVKNLKGLAAAKRAVAIHHSFSLCLHLDAALRLNGAESEVAAPLQTEEVLVTLEEIYLCCCY
jgi:hypothetical protein